MTIKERIELARLGYTKEEIKAFAEEEAAAAAAPVQPEAAPEEAPAAAPSSAASDLMNAITTLTQAIQASNIVNSRQPAAAQDVTVESVLADILK